LLKNEGGYWLVELKQNLGVLHCNLAQAVPVVVCPEGRNGAVRGVFHALLGGGTVTIRLTIRLIVREVAAGAGPGASISAAHATQ
jgi:hypothetical protein